MLVYGKPLTGKTRVTSKKNEKKNKNTVNNVDLGGLKKEFIFLVINLYDLKQFQY